MRESKFGENEAIFLTCSLDTWGKYTRGSSARVYESYFRNQDHKIERYAFKIMRHDKIDYATPLFLEEVKILSHLSDVPGVMKVKEIGFVLFDDKCEFPSDNKDSQARHMTGKALQMDLTEATTYLGMFTERLAEGWLPYLALKEYPKNWNLWILCDDFYNKGKKVLVMEKRVQALSQICDILALAHERQIVFRDHKILHYYWNHYRNHVEMIDWNVGKYFEDGIPEDEKVKDLILFSVYTAYWVLSGNSFPNVEKFLTSSDQILAAAHPYKIDDEVLARVDYCFRETIGKAAAGGYANAAELGKDILQDYQNHK